MRRCGTDRNSGLLGWLASLLERTAHAQSGCSETGCAGEWQSISTTQCGGGNCSALVMAVNNGTSVCTGNQQDGTTSCAGAVGCSPYCSTTTCIVPDCGGGGGCTPDKGLCITGADCCSGNCIAGTCQSEDEID
jgi:hypothetical protein